MRERNVYLAGAITGLTAAEAIDWRDKVKHDLAFNKRLVEEGLYPSHTVGQEEAPEGFRYAYDPTGIVGFSPMRAKDYLLERGVLSGHPEAYEDQVLSSAKGILTRDRWDVMKNCDLVLVNLIGATKVSIGTVMEIAYADANRTPCVVAMEDDNVHHHAMLDTAVGWIAKDLDFAVEIVKAILLPDGISIPA